MRNDTVLVGIAEGKVIRKPGILVSYALGSCIGICLWDRGAGVAGMVHILLPSRRDSLDQTNPCKFADSGTGFLLESMIRAGAYQGRITAKIAGGARMFPANGASEAVGERNIKAARKSLEQLGIPLLAEDTGKDYGRTIRFDAETGQLEIKTVKRRTIVI